MLRNYGTCCINCVLNKNLTKTMYIYYRKALKRSFSHTETCSFVEARPRMARYTNAHVAGSKPDQWCHYLKNNSKWPSYPGGGGPFNTQHPYTWQYNVTALHLIKVTCRSLYPFITLNFFRNTTNAAYAVGKHPAHFTAE